MHLRNPPKMGAATLTPLFKSTELSGRYGAVVFVKDESRNPFGTFKDRRCAALLEKCHGEPQTIFVHITSGNSGYSLGMLALEEERQTGKKTTVVNLVPKGISPIIKAKLETCSLVHEIDITGKILSHNDLVALAREVADYHGPAEFIHGVEDFGVVNGYTTIIDELAAAGIKPQRIFCPMGGGELATELVRRAAEVWPDHTPKIFGISIEENVLLHTDNFIAKLRRNVADKLVCGYSRFKEFILRYRGEGRLSTLSVSERTIMREYDYLNRIGIHCEPSAAVAFAGACEVGPPLDENTITVIVNTGKGIYDQNAADKVWRRKVGRVAKYIAVAFTSAAIVAGLTLPAIFAHIKQQELIYSHLLSEANFYMDSRKGGNPSPEDSVKACRFIRDDESCGGIYSTLFLTPKELEFYVRYKRYDIIPDLVGRDMQRQLYGDWKASTFKCIEFDSYYCSSNNGPKVWHQ